MKLSLIGGVATLCVAGLLACSPKKSPNTAAATPPEVYVTEVIQQDTPIRREWVATLDGSANVDIRARVQGYLTKQCYMEGTVVKAGDLLFEIDPRPLEAALAQAKADLAKAQAAAVNAAQEEQRQAQMFKSNATSTANRDSAVQNSAAAKAEVDARSAAVDQAQLNLEYCKITSPVDGIAGNALPGVGDLVGPGDTQALTTVSTVDPIKATFQLSEQEYIKVAERINEALLGEKANFRKSTLELILADESVLTQKGHFIKINRQVDAKTGTIEIGTAFPNVGNLLRPGQFARVRAVVKTKQGAILVPQRAVNELQGSYQVAVVGADGKVDIRSVKAAETVGSLWLIDEGLKPGDKVVVDGFQKVRQGAPVTALPWANTKPEAK